MPIPVRIALVVGGTALYLGLAVAGLGSLSAFLAQRALLALAAVTAAMVAAALFAGGNLSSGEREDRGNRWVIAAFLAIGVADAYLPAYSDRVELWTVGGDGLRWIGVGLYAVGGVLRLWPVFVLGDRFSGLVAIQPGHRLVTSGVYAVIRHPSYLGMLVLSLGWGLAFRSGLGVLLALLLVPPLVARIEAEERLLHERFGQEYDAYRARTWRLVPPIY